MAKYTITYKCGDTEEMQLFGKETERQRKIQWLETQLCPLHKREQETQSALAQAKERGLPTLSGISEKQVAFGERVRAELLRKIDTWIKETEGKREKYITAGQGEAFDAQMAEIKNGYRRLTDQSQASWWIDRRDKPSNELLKEMVQTQEKGNDHGI